MNSAGRKSRRGKRKRFLWIVINGRIGPAGRPGANDFIAKCVTRGELTARQLFCRLAFYARAIPVGKQRALSFQRARRPLQCNRSVEIVVGQLASRRHHRRSRRDADFRKFYDSASSSAALTARVLSRASAAHQGGLLFMSFSAEPA